MHLVVGFSMNIEIFTGIAGWAYGIVGLTIKEDVPMLIITRRLGESVHIGSDVVVAVTQVGVQVRLAITAPKEIPIVRSELLSREEVEVSKE